MDLVVDLATKAMDTLLGKLGEVIKREYKLQKGVRKKVNSFSTELKIMQIALRKVAEVPRDQIDDHVKLWAADIRELSYDMEDVVDSLLVRIEGRQPKANQDSLKKIMSKMSNLFKKGKARREISTAVEDIHARLQDVTSRYQLFNFPNLPAAPKKTPVDPFLEVFYGDRKNIIGLEKARDNIIKKIGEGGAVSKERLKILSIVGFGGLGKTTLAREVYDAHPAKFHCKSFVSVSRNPDIKRVLSDLLFKLGDRRDTVNFDEKQLLILIKEFLTKKRYFIIIDDLWDINAWIAIKHALIDNECGSIIITTTRHVNVSKFCCSFQEDMIHQMTSLSDNDSKKLFYGRIFSSEVCNSGFEELSKKILDKCAGVPLVILNLASYLSNNQKINQWYRLLTSIGSGLTKGDDNVEEMKRILSLSYYDLPSYLKPCFLYLSIFPEDHQISRDRLIRRWISEDFIQVQDQKSLLEVGDLYFNELLNRNMIQPIMHVDGRVEACSLHDIMLDLICELSREDNFVTIVDVRKKDTTLEENFRRLSLQKSITNLTTTHMNTTNMPKVRSFTAFNPATSLIPHLSRFQVLRVLDLEGCDLRGSLGDNLRHVESLLHLRYLGLRGTKVGKLPIEIGKLHFLQTLDLQQTNSNELSSSVVELRNLICLLLDIDMQLPKGFSNMTSLEQLVVQGVAFSASGSAIELGYLIMLRDLAFTWAPRNLEGIFLQSPNDLRTDKPLIDYIGHAYRNDKDLIESLGNDLSSDKALIKSLEKLCNLENLEISSAIPWVTNQISARIPWVNVLMLDWVPPTSLSRLKCDGYFESLPTWICCSSLPQLSYLDLRVQKVRSEDIQILGILPYLRYLNLPTNVDKGVNRVKKLVLSAGAFPSVRVCLFPKLLLVQPTFQRGAMPVIQRLQFGLQLADIINLGFNLSVHGLHSLQRIRIDIGSTKSSTHEDYSRAMKVLSNVVDDHPGSLTLQADKFEMY